MTQIRSPISYRPDLDGLRAVAILLVLVYHGELPLFPSGFIGVDVFFVISGFLISSIIHEKIANQSFSFSEFYSRRLWRLQPLLLCFLFVAIFSTLILFLPEDLLQFSRSARKTSLFIANLFFNQTTTGYFSPNTQQLPLLHMWSLAIEWQYYLIFPFILWVLHRLFRGKSLLVILYATTLISILLSLYYSKTLPAQTYYQFSSRLFEFLIGSCIALTPVRAGRINKHLLNIFGLMALLIIIYSASLNNILRGYPNEYAFSVCLATGFLILLGRLYPGGLSVQILSFKPLVFIGVLSYSLYLWHWLVFSLLRYQNWGETNEVLLGAYSVTFILSYVSWNYIEKPARALNRIHGRYTFLILLIIPIVVVHLIDYSIKTHSGFPARFNQELVQVYQKLNHYASAQRPLCIGSNQTDKKSFCTIGAITVGSKKGLMIGDSFSNHYWGFIDTLGQAANLNVLVQGTSSCLTLPGIYLYDWWNFKNQIYQECREQTEVYYQKIQKNHYDYVILGQIWTNYLSDHVINHLGDARSLELTKKRLSSALDESLKIITISGAKPVLLKSTALTEKNLSDCFFQHIKSRRVYDPKECLFALTVSSGDIWFDQLFEKLKIKYPQLIIIDPKIIQCEHKYCKSELQGIPVYRDAGHITDYASYKLGSLYLKKLGNPLT